MAAPALRIPLSIPMERFQRDMDKARSVTADGTRQVVQLFSRMNSAVQSDLRVTTSLIGGLAGATRLLLPAAGAAAGFIILSNAIKTAREELDKLIEIGDKAQKAGVGAGFFQAFSEGARKATDDAKVFEKFLDNAFNATKIKAGEENQLIALLDKIAAAGAGGGLQSFSIAANQEERVKSILQTMQELEKSGARMVALDLGEKMFGAEFVDRIRRGQDSIDGVIARLNEAQQRLQSGSDFLPQDQIERAKELRDRLAEAHRVIDREMKPAWDSLRSVMLDIKNLWVLVIEGASRVATVLANLPNILSVIQNSPVFSAIPALIKLVGLMPNLAATAPGSFSGSGETGAKVDSGGAPRLELTGKSGKFVEREIKAAKQAATDTKDAFDRAIESANRHASAMIADAAAVGLSNAAQAQLRTEMMLLEAARRSGVEITDEQIEAYAKLRGEMTSAAALKAVGIALEGENAAAFERTSARIRAVAEATNAVKTRFDEISSASRELGSALSDAFKGAVLEGRKLDEILRNLSNRLAGKAIDSLFDAAFATPKGGGTAPFLSLFSGLIGPGKAAGGPVSPGMVYPVGERGKEWFAPNVPGRIIPNDAARRSSGGMTFAPSSNIVINGNGVTIDEVRMALAQNNRMQEHHLKRGLSSQLSRLSKLGAL